MDGRVVSSSTFIDALDQKPKIQPYDFQEQLIARAAESFRHSEAVLMVGPCGMGKTVVFCAIIERALRKGKKILILLHRVELIDQVSRMLARFGVEHSFIAPGYLFFRSCAVQVASVFTLVRRLDDIDDPDLIIVDEAHRCILNSTFGKIIAAFPKAKRLGVTASPARLGGEPLKDLFQEMIIGPTTRELMDMGFLSDYRIFPPPIADQADLSGLHMQAGDYVRSEISELMDKPKIIGNAVTEYRKHADGLRAIAFCCSVQHAQNVAADFNANGYVAASIDGTMDRNYRRRLVDGFRDGSLKILTSCDIANEGLDIVGIQCGLLLRPTKSLTLRIQQVGRCLRAMPGKTHAILLDFVDGWKTHGLPDSDYDWSLEGNIQKKRAAKKDTSEATKICPGCFSAIRRTARVCRYCQYEFTPTSREVVNEEGELVELDVKTIRKRTKMEQGSAQSFEDLVKIGFARHMKSPHAWARIILKARAKKEAERAARKQQQQQPLINEHDNRWLDF